MKSIVKFLPFAMILVDGISFLLVDQEWYKSYYLIHSDLVGHSLATGLFMLFFAYRLRLCIYTKLTVYSLIAYNIVNLVDSLVYLQDYMLYMGVIILYGILNGIILIVNHAGTGTILRHSKN